MTKRLSENRLDNTTAVTIMAMGASIIEKHITLDRSVGGLDDSVSLQSDKPVAHCNGAKTSWSALGGVHYCAKFNK